MRAGTPAAATSACHCSSSGLMSSMGISARPPLTLGAVDVCLSGRARAPATCRRMLAPCRARSAGRSTARRARTPWRRQLEGRGRPQAASSPSGRLASLSCASLITPWPHIVEPVLTFGSPSPAHIRLVQTASLHERSGSFRKNGGLRGDHLRRLHFAATTCSIVRAAAAARVSAAADARLRLFPFPRFLFLPPRKAGTLARRRYGGQRIDSHYAADSALSTVFRGRPRTTVLRATQERPSFAPLGVNARPWKSRGRFPRRLPPSRGAYRRSSRSRVSCWCLGSCGTQLLPPSVVLRMTPAPATQPWSASAKSTPHSVAGVRAACLSQVLPPSVVAMMLPALPTAHP